MDDVIDELRFDIFKWKLKKIGKILVEIEIWVKIEKKTKKFFFNFKQILNASLDYTWIFYINFYKILSKVI